jgi:hypothetical protein
MMLSLRDQLHDHSDATAGDSPLFFRDLIRYLRRLSSSGTEIGRCFCRFDGSNVACVSVVDAVFWSSLETLFSVRNRSFSSTSETAKNAEGFRVFSNQFQKANA